MLNGACFSVHVCVGDMSESKAHQVEIREVDGQTLRKLVDYIYTAEIEVTEDNVQVRESVLGSVEEEDSKEEETGVDENV